MRVTVDGVILPLAGKIAMVGAILLLAGRMAAMGVGVTLPPVGEIAVVGVILLLVGETAAAGVTPVESKDDGAARRMGTPFGGRCLFFRSRKGD